MSAAEYHQTPEDARLLELLRTHDPRAAEFLLESYGDRIYGLSWRILGSAEDASEAVQETFLTVLAKWETFAGRSRFSSWIYRLAANCAYQQLRRRRRYAVEVSLDDDAAWAETTDGSEAAALPGSWLSAALAPDQSLLRAELQAVIAAAIGRLPPAYRTAFVLKDLEDMSLKDIAEAMELSEAAVKSRVHRARLAMRRELQAFLQDYRARPPGAAAGTARQGEGSR